MDIHIGHGVSRQLRSSVTRYEPPYRHSLGLVPPVIDSTVNL
jgi:hypothetical protein